MKLFHFQYVDQNGRPEYGSSYSTMAETEEEAFEAIKLWFQKKIDNGTDFDKEFYGSDLKTFSNYKENNLFKVNVLGVGDVLDTEVA